MARWARWARWRGGLRRWAAGGVFALMTLAAQAAPTVALTSPSANAVFTAWRNVTLSAAASPSVGATIKQVAFYQGTTLIGTVYWAPYSLTWWIVPPGSYSLTAEVTDSQNQTVTSAVVPIVVDTPPSVNLASPSAYTVFTAPATITLTATATDSDGSVAKVDFYQGATLIGTATSAPYTVTWANAPAGSYSLTAKVTDDKGLSTTSWVVPITVNATPTVTITSPAANAAFAAPANLTITASASDTDGTVSSVAFYRGTTLIGTAYWAPYRVSWTNVPSGAYTLTARVTDNRGAATTSTPVPITIGAAPTVALTAPAANARFTAPATITLAATAFDSDGTVAKVDFYQGTTLIGSATAAPYSVSWADVPAGAYTLTAKATDNHGVASASAAVTITVAAGGTAVYYLHGDHLDTPRLAMDEQGVVVWRRAPLDEPFGMSPPEEDPDGNGVAFVLNLRFPGQYFDRETNFNYNYFRDYDPQTGRYVQSDPIGLAGGINPYSYVGGNPLSRKDQLGLLYPSDFIGGITDLVRGRYDMVDAATQGADAYFHCRANCEASRRGPGGYHAAVIGSSIREVIQNEPPQQRARDEAANAQGQCAGRDKPEADCYKGCENLIPPWGIPQRHLPPNADPRRVYRPVN